MDEAQNLFREGVLTLRNEKNAAKAQQLLMHSLKLNPQNEMAWLWLARALNEPRQQLDCIERALRINPENEQALALRQEILASAKNSTTTRPAAPAPTGTTPVPAFLPVKKLTTTGSSKTAKPPEQQAQEMPQVRSPSAQNVSAAPPPEKVRQTQGIVPLRATQTQNTAVVSSSQTQAQPPAANPSKRETQNIAPLAAVPLAELPEIESARAARPRQLSISDKRRIEALLDKANVYVEANELEAAVEQWVKVLQIQVDHEEAMRSAVRVLSKLKYMEDAKELVWRALNGGTEHPSIYLTAIEIAEREGDRVTADDLRDRVVQLSQANESVVIHIADYFIRTKAYARALDVLQKSLPSHPDSQKILVRIGNVYDEMGNEAESAHYYDRAAQLGTGTKEGQLADKKMSQYVPMLSDKERGSLLMAWREALGFGTAALLLAFQDAGLNFLNLGGARWMGVGLAIVGGYLLITATSSPQQRGLGRLMGGRVPEEGFDGEEHGGVIQQETALPMIPAAARVILGLVGAGLLVGALALVFSTALRLLSSPAESQVPDFCDAVYFFNDELNRMIGC
ncbi:MAG: hypothetical protein HXY40_14825 [Chloroflexi bacterium]|nr:hypothetical protein [Chloroflexota bacterium]